MNVWKVTDADRGPDGRIWIHPPARTLADLLPATTPEPEEETQRVQSAWQPGRAELAGLVGGIVLAVALIAGLNVFAPAAAPRAQPTAAPTLAPTLASTTAPTIAPPTALPPTPEMAPVVAPAPPPEPQVVYIEPPCDVSVNPRYVATIDLSPLGSATGVSCSSQAEAQANADAMAAELRVQAMPTEPPAPSWVPPLVRSECADWHPPQVRPEGC